MASTLVQAPGAYDLFTKPQTLRVPYIDRALFDFIFVKQQPDNVQFSFFDYQPFWATNQPPVGGQDAWVYRAHTHAHCYQ